MKKLFASSKLAKKYSRAKRLHQVLSEARFIRVSHTKNKEIKRLP